MSIQDINVGTSANAGNGDSIRTAFIKVNENFRNIASNLGEIPNGKQNSLVYFTSSTGLRSTDKMLYTTSTLYLGDESTSTYNMMLTSCDQTDDTISVVQVHNYSKATSLNFYRYRGTIENKLSLVKDDELGKISFTTITPSNLDAKLEIKAVVDNNVFSNSVPISMVISLDSGVSTIDVLKISSNAELSVYKLKNLYGSSVNISSNLYPENTNSYNLGSSNYKWNSIHALTNNLTTVNFSNNTTQTTAYQFIDTVPTTSNDPGVKGQLAISGSDLYLCVNDNNWIKFTGTTF